MILESPQVVRVKDQPTATIPFAIPRVEMKSVIGPAIQELIAATKAQGLSKTGPWFAHHLTLSDEFFDFEVSIPVSGSLSASGRAVPGLWPAGIVARAIYRGDYADLPIAWAEFSRWIDAAGHQRARHIYEVYTVTPATAPNPAEWVTELNWPLLTTPAGAQA